MNKKKVLIASVLKPVNEPRMYKKLGLSLAEMGNLEIHIAGYHCEEIPKVQGIHFHPIFNFNRLSFERFNSNIRFYKLLEELKPDIIIVNTFELLGPSVKFKKKHGVKLIYDIRENHRLNILTLGIYPFPINHLLATYVKIKESKYSKEIDHFILAERCYENQIPFLSKPFTIIENKYADTLFKKTARKEGRIRLLFAGTVHKSTGIFVAIDLIQKLNAIENIFELMIIGHCAQKSVYDEIHKIEVKHIYKEIDIKPISPEKIIAAYQKANVILAPYLISEQNKDKIPTKLYEALALGIPMIISANSFWQQLVKNHEWILSMDFQLVDKKEIIEFCKRDFGEITGLESARWHSEKQKLKCIDIFLD